MAKQKNPDRIRISTPRVTLKYPKLTEVDYGTEKFPDKDGSYNTRIILDTADPKVAAMLTKIDTALERAKELAEEAFAALPVKDRKRLEAKGGITADAPYSIVYDDETEEDTGKVELRVKMKASGTRKDKTKWTAKPDLFDAKGKPLPKGVQIWGGTVAIINFDIEPYFVAGTGAYGVSRRLNAAQIIELVSGGQRAASSYGFGEVEDGFDSDGYEVEEEETTSDDAGTAADDGDETDF